MTSTAHPANEPAPDPAHGADPQHAATAPEPPRSWALLPLDLLRGFLIGITELVPGVSGSTVAMIVRVYEPIIRSADHVVSAGRALLRGRSAAFRAELKEVDWRLMLPLGAGMVAAILLLAGLLHDLVEGYPLSSLGLFFGIVVVGIAAPLQMVRWRGTLSAVHVLLFLVFAAAAFFLTGLATDSPAENPSMIAVFLAAAVAICALVIPGVSGSFMLLAMGLYAPTLQAVSERDLAYVGVFGLGALVGLVSIVRVIRVALVRIPHLAAASMAGLMAGSLRALWPWEPGADYTTGDVVGPLLLMVAGAVFVLFTLWVSRRSSRAV
ncbi:DUF368 domain-containing protein [Brevibacterium album]|uniref:DUF368 domain-containing protein n=1 Tax=Brevibacterium album TaxID=417948 RepID=UPI000408CC2A|nr:DUF368 domain-containing protein [Brevibacterium album]